MPQLVRGYAVGNLVIIAVADPARAVELLREIVAPLRTEHVFRFNAGGVKHCALCVKYAAGDGRKPERAAGVIVFAGGDFVLFVNRPMKMYDFAGDVRPFQAEQLAGAQAGQNLKPIGVDVDVRHDFVIKHRVLALEQPPELVGLQNTMLRAFCAFGKLQILNKQRGIFVFTAKFQKLHEACAHPDKGLLREMVFRVCAVYDVLNILLVQLDYTFAADYGIDVVSAVAFIFGVVVFAGGLLQIVDISVERRRNLNTLVLDTLVKPCVGFGVALALTGPPGCGRVEEPAHVVLLDGDVPQFPLVVPLRRVGSRTFWHKNNTPFT